MQLDQEDRALTIARWPQYQEALYSQFSVLNGILERALILVMLARRER